MMNFTQYAENAAPEIGVILGSGLGSAMDSWLIERSSPFSEIEGIPPSTVEGHAGTMHLAKIGDKSAIVACGRIHLYEGHSAHDVTAIVRFFANMGCKLLVITNAAGTLHPAMPPHSWMIIRDHLNLTGTTPLLGGANFFDMTHVYDAALSARLSAVGHEFSMQMGTGIYAGVLGPQYETPAEIQMLRTLGADAVGMSTVLEAIQARALGMRICGLSRLTNWGAGLGDGELSHQEVIAGQKVAGEELGQLLARCFSSNSVQA